VGARSASASVSGGATWVRAPKLEADPYFGGVHARTFLDHGGRRALVAFRGICLDNEFRQCEVDKCFLESLKAFGVISDMVYATRDACKDMVDDLDYFPQAEAVVKRVQADHPDYAVMLTGHSLGGALAISVAASQPGVLKAVTFAPSAFHNILRESLGLSEVQIQALPADDLVAVGDPYDCLINAVYVHEARLGSTTCLLEGTEEPWPCEPRMKVDLMYDQQTLARTIQCKARTHDWSRYEQVLVQKAPHLSHQCCQTSSSRSASQPPPPP